MGRSASGRSIFGNESVRGRSRVAYPAARINAFSGLRTLVPRGQVLLLLGRELVLLDAHCRQLEAGDLGVDLLRHVVDLALERRGVLDDELGRESLVREGHVHDLGRVPLGSGEIDETPVSEQEELAAVRERELLDERTG